MTNEGEALASLQYSRTAIDFLLNEGRASNEEEANILLRELKQPSIDILIKNGASVNHARKFIDQIFDKIGYALTSSSGCVESRIQGYIETETHTEFLMGVIALTSYDFDLYEHMELVIGPGFVDVSLNSTMRNLGFWKDKLTPEQFYDVFTDIINYAKPKVLKNVFALHSDKILNHLGNDEELTNKLLGISFSAGAVLPILSAVKIDDLPEQFREETRKYVGLDNQLSISDKIRGTKIVDLYPNVCQNLYGLWIETLFYDFGHIWGKEGELYGHLTLVYVQEQLVGAIKHTGAKSFLALDTIQNSDETLPLVLGGVYAVNEEVIDQARTAYKEQGSWAKMNLEQLSVMPIRFLSEKKTFDDIKRHANELRNVRYSSPIHEFY